MSGKADYNNDIWTAGQESGLIKFVESFYLEDGKPKTLLRFKNTSTPVTAFLNKKSKEQAFKKYLALVESGRLPRPCNFDEVVSQAEKDTSSTFVHTERLVYNATVEDMQESLFYLQSNLNQWLPSVSIYETAEYMKGRFELTTAEPVEVMNLMANEITRLQNVVELLHNSSSRKQCEIQAGQIVELAQQLAEMNEREAKLKATIDKQFQELMQIHQKETEIEPLKLEIESLKLKLEDTEPLEKKEEEIESLKLEIESLKLKLEDTEPLEKKEEEIESLKLEIESLKLKLEDTEPLEKKEAEIESLKLQLNKADELMVELDESKARIHNYDQQFQKLDTEMGKLINEKQRYQTLCTRFSQSSVRLARDKNMMAKRYTVLKENSARLAKEYCSRAKQSAHEKKKREKLKSKLEKKSTELGIYVRRYKNLYLASETDKKTVLKENQRLQTIEKAVDQLFLIKKST